VKKTDSIIILITAGSEEEAHTIAESLVKGKKAACVNIVPGVESLFWWKGQPGRAFYWLRQRHRYFQK
jgi:uncharacterized protein involved in tolerance to divalent cations